MKILFSLGFIIGLCLYHSSKIDEKGMIFFSSFIIVGNIVGLLSILKEDIVEELKK